MLPHLEKEARDRQEKSRQEQGRDEKGRFQPVQANLPGPEQSLDESQRALAAAKALPLIEEEARKRQDQVTASPTKNKKKKSKLEGEAATEAGKKAPFFYGTVR